MEGSFEMQQHYDDNCAWGVAMSSYNSEEKEKAPNHDGIVKDKSSKGLRNLTRRVCRAVKSKCSTTYVEVANELVAEEANFDQDGRNEQKNVKRRVYDALNVLMAMNIIGKDKKEIKWIGLPGVKQELEHLKKERALHEEQIEQKKKQIKELQNKYLLFKRLIERNKEIENKIVSLEKKSNRIVCEKMDGKDSQHLPPSSLNATGLATSVSRRISLPFLIICTSTRAKIDLYMNESHTHYTFDFTMPFSIYQESQVIQQMNLAPLPNESP